MLYSILFILLLFGCDTVDIKERVVYEDTLLPVVDAPVRQWTHEGFKGTTKTDKNGTWTLTVPPDTIINLCIYDPIGKFEACFATDALLTPSLESGSDQMIEL
jgi:hypothetical protein